MALTLRSIACCACLYRWGSNKTGSSTGVNKGPFSGELGVDELMKRGRPASWVVSNLVRTPTLPGTGKVMWLSGSPWDRKGLSQERRVTYSATGLQHHENPACPTPCTFRDTREMRVEANAQQSPPRRPF